MQESATIAPPRQRRVKRSIIPLSFAELPDDTLLAQEATLAFIGGTEPIHPASLFRGIRDGRYPRPVKIGPNSNRWVLGELREAQRRMVAADRTRKTGLPRGRKKAA
jgi:predicted DNA-binding transcriptional regulator AlpA